MNDEKVNDIFNNWWKATGCQLLSLEWDAKHIAGSAYVEAFNRAQLRHATDTQAIKLLTAVRDAYTISGKFPPVELVLHTVNEALKALNHDATEAVTTSIDKKGMMMNNLQELIKLVDNDNKSAAEKSAIIWNEIISIRAENVQLTYKLDRARAVVDVANEIHNLVGNRFDGKWANLASALYAARGL